MNYHNITYPDMNNGEGLRVVLWLSGCSHKCKGCQNPQTWDTNSGILFDESVKKELFRELDKDYISGLTLTGGDPLFKSNLDEVLDLVTWVNIHYNIQRNIVLNDEMKHNILCCNPDKIRLSSPQKNIWLYTGYTWDECQTVLKGIELDPNGYCNIYNRNNKKRQQIISQCDVLIDGKYIESQRDITLKWCGSKNQNIIDIQKSLKHGKIVLWCN